MMSKWKEIRTVTVPNDQLSLAIGREGQNVRLAWKLTGTRLIFYLQIQMQLKGRKSKRNRLREEVKEEVVEGKIRKRRTNRGKEKKRLLMKK